MNSADLLNPSFLIFLGIIILLIALLTLYFENKHREQNHKITSMLSLVSTLADEINNCKIGLNNLTLMVGGAPILKRGENNINSSKLITVSDEDDDDEEDDEEDDDEEDDDEDDSEDDEDDEDTDANADETNILSLDEITDLNIIKVNNNEKLGELDVDNLDEFDELYDELDDELDELDTKLNNTTKKIDLIDLSEEVKIEITDFKKLSLTKLRSIVSEKQLTPDPTKLKKNDLIKLLEKS